MRDLKHLIYFENLLQEANNDLVKQAKSDGKLALGYTCYFMPEVLLDLPGCFSVRLRAPRCTSPGNVKKLCKQHNFIDKFSAIMYNFTG